MSTQSQIAGMKGSKATTRRNRNSKQMWKCPRTAHIAIVKYGLVVLKEIKDGIPNK